MADFWQLSGQTWPQDSFKRVRLEKWCRTHLKSPQETNSNAISRHFLNFVRRRPTYKVSFWGGGRVPLDLRLRGPLEAKSFVRGPKIDPPGAPGRVFDVKYRSCGHVRRCTRSKLAPGLERIDFTPCGEGSYFDSADINISVCETVKPLSNYPNTPMQSKGLLGFF